MGTTDLFVELIVIGVGAVGWISLFALTLVGYDRPLINTVIGTPAAAVPALAFTYLLGIIVDRIADADRVTRWIAPESDKTGHAVGRFHNPLFRACVGTIATAAFVALGYACRYALRKLPTTEVKRLKDHPQLPRTI